LGSADVPFEILGRKDDTRETVVLGVPRPVGDDEVSSESVIGGFFIADILRV